MSNAPQIISLFTNDTQTVDRVLVLSSFKGGKAMGTCEHKESYMTLGGDKDLLSSLVAITRAWARLGSPQVEQCREGLH
jgi:hypothetical protein